MRIRGLLKNNSQYDIDIRRHCEDPSHVVSCARTAVVRAGKTIYRPNPGVNRLLEWPMPELQVHRGSIWQRWTAHLPNKSNRLLLTDADLRSRINEVRENCGRFLCPVITATQHVPEMRRFDPRDCECVFLEGRENIEWPLPSSLHSGNGCRLDTSRQLFPARQSSRFAVSEPKSIFDILERQHKTRHSDERRFGSNPQFWPCCAGNGCIVLNYERRVRFERGGAVDQQWYQALEPASYSLTEDEEGFEIYWCRQKQCRNYYGHFPGFSRIIRMADYHKAVDARTANAKNTYA